jgi:hypothetical protein
MHPYEPHRAFANLCLLLLVLGACGDPMADIRRSHVEGNEPQAADFQPFLDRDLLAYGVAQYGGGLSQSVELLRKGPTQSGISYPKYYAWVAYSRDGDLVAQGAVRVQAIERERFEVTDFASAESIRSNPQSVYAIFPAALCDAIIQHAKAAV